jgi:TusE/DsrC/DsvC family sulfur relay protein
MISHATEVQGYKVDDLGFLEDFDQWNDEFAELMAPGESIRDGLTDLHRGVLAFIRDYYTTHGRCPGVARPCRCFHLSYGQFLALFPSGYRHGALKLAGIPCGACDEPVPFEPSKEQEYS